MTAGRFCEFARAVVKRNLSESGKKIHYFGLFLKGQVKENHSALRSQVYQWWDDSALAPPQQRPPSEEEEVGTREPSLEVLAWAGGAAKFPQLLVDRFPDGSEEREKILTRRKEFDQLFPAAQQPAPASGNGRAGGVCDYSIDGGVEPLDVFRLIDLPSSRFAEFSTGRPGPCKILVY